MRKLIKVTASHIKQGKKNRECFCPVAIALLDAGFDRVRVTGDFLIVRYEDKQGTEYDLCLEAPEKVSNFVEAFDEGTKGARKPFSFVLNFDPTDPTIQHKD